MAGGASATGSIYDSILSFATATLTPERLRHSVAVAELAAALCTRHGLDPGKGRIAGIGHDIAREYNARETLAYLRRHRLCSGRWERAHPVVLHGRVGRALLKERFGIRDREILDAVRDHVLGRPGMGRLAQILYTADFLEPGRAILPEAERLALIALPLDEAVARVTGEIFRFLGREDKPIAPVTKKMYDRLTKALKERDA
jgi:predicted HD superfamily hydrolase involved in NAD metabolism